ncbi:hypothetical protein PPERSA_01968 [Pseudocohnilembus persalinus]|uniref:protein phosphatase methylesterase-1 n=1 Tax=Pseudocohnilembus persalinus TaxID=266149 RepID=A0A0V0R3K5_PSEPJ|nr:hypothetical protein PPERSA_01968 [Pseudocohnilembus persalinus]|eukprot:KRX09081.1 hypothetical protein PPERSA_01968 [Pseudocohnilembus persalinus]
MSNLLKKALNKGKPPKPGKSFKIFFTIKIYLIFLYIENEFNEEDEDYDEQEEEKDTFETKFPTSGPIKAQHFNLPKPNNNQNFPNISKKIHDYSPIDWRNFFDTQDFMEDGTPVYKSGSEGPIFFCMHGAGDSALTFSRLAKEISQFAQLVSFDFRGHGFSKKLENTEDLSIETLIQDCSSVLDFVAKKYPDPTIIIVGHSMGGSVAAKFCKHALQGQHASRIQGLIVIDVVEGTAMDALPFMEQIVSQRPSFFRNMQDVIKWSIQSHTIRNLNSARVSIQSQVKEGTNQYGEKGYVWKVNLMKSEKHWKGWFIGLTNAFLDVRVPKLLMTAEKERMDKDLTIAQMQGRFKLTVLFQTGHYMHEDDYHSTAEQFHQFLHSFKIPGNIQEQQKIKEMGVGKYFPPLKDYHKPTKQI